MIGDRHIGHLSSLAKGEWRGGIYSISTSLIRHIAVLTKANCTNAGMPTGQKRPGQGEVVADHAELLHGLRGASIGAEDRTAVASTGDRFRE